MTMKKDDDMLKPFIGEWFHLIQVYIFFKYNTFLRLDFFTPFLYFFTITTKKDYDMLKHYIGECFHLIKVY